MCEQLGENQMEITLKLFAGLSEYLPDNAVRNEVQFKIQSACDIQTVLDYHGVPVEQCHLVLANGVYVPPSERNSYILSEGDILAVWPPIAGG